MRKLLCVLIVVIGIAVIGTGVYLQLNNAAQENEEEIKEIKFERINTFEVAETCTTYNKVSTYMNTNDYTKISFNYPDCVHEYDLSFWYKMLNNEDDSIKINVTKQNDTMNNYLNEKKAKLISMKNDDYYKDLTYTDTTEITTTDGLKISILEANYKHSFLSIENTYDVWYIAAQMDEEVILTYEITTKDKVMSYKAIEELFNNLKIEKKAATFINSTKEGEYQIGSIRQNIDKSYEHGYKINYKISNKYPEVDSFGSNYDESTFEYEDVTNKFYANIAIEKDNFYDTLQESAELSHKTSLSSYKSDNEKYRNTKDTGLVKKKINDKDVYYFIYKYDYYLENKKALTGYLSYVYYEVVPHFYVKININTKNIEINEAIISEFLNFTVEEY